MIDDPDLEEALDVLMANAISDVELLRRYRARFGLKTRDMVNAVEDPAILRQTIHQILNLVDQQSSMFSEPSWLFSLYRAIIVQLQYHVPQNDGHPLDRLTVVSSDD